MSTNFSSFAAAATRTAARATARTGSVVAPKAVRPVLQSVKLVRTGGNSANGLLAIGGASLLINKALSTQSGVTVAALLTDVAACPRVSNPLGKVSDHLGNNLAYAAPARLAACGIWQALKADGLTNGLPALCIDGKPVDRVTRKGLQTLANALPGAVLTSPLLAAIAAYTSGKPCPDWARAYGMPQEATTQTATDAAPTADNTAQEAAATTKTRRRRTKAIDAA